MRVNDASRIVLDDSRVTLQIGATPVDNSRGVINNRNMFIVQAIGLEMNEEKNVRKSVFKQCLKSVLKMSKK